MNRDETGKVAQEAEYIDEDQTRNAASAAPGSETRFGGVCRNAQRRMFGARIDVAL
jgi:hypothetical protein